MFRRSAVSALAIACLTATSASSAPAAFKWPPWLSVESPVSPFDPTTRGALMLVHVSFRDGEARLDDLQGTAEGIVAGWRRSVPLRFQETGRPNTFALRRQWPTEGTWLVRLVTKHTTAIVTFDGAGNVASARVPTERSSGGDLPRAVGAREIDSTLALAARR
jgi:hypothetical protein